MVSIVWGLALPAPVHAQGGLSLPRSAQPELRPPQFEPIQPPQPVPEVNVPELAPMRAPPGAENVRFVLKGLDIEGVTAYPLKVIEGIYAKLIGTEVSLAQIYDIADQIQRRYRKDGYFLARTIIPAQTSSEGRLRILVFEGYISDVRVEGDAGPVIELVKRYLKNLPGDRPLKLKSLERYLLLTNDIPGVVAKGVLRPSPDKVGAAELIVTVERHPFNAVFSMDNLGSSYTGEWEAAVNLSANSFTQLGEGLTASGLLSEPFDFNSRNQRVAGLQGSIHPWASGFYFKMTASYGQSNPGGDIAQLDAVDTKLWIRPAVGYPIIRTRDCNLFVEMGFDFIDSNTDIFNNVAFARDKLRVLYLTAFGDVRDEWGGASFASLGLRQGLPIFGASESGDLLLSREGASGDFTSINMKLSRLQHISGPFSLLLKAAGQYAFSEVLIDEEFGVGSFNFGRGYNPNELSEDNGVGFTAELQYTRPTNFRYLDRYQIFGFCDFGEVWDHRTGDSASLSSAGAGVRTWFTRCFSTELTAAQPLGIVSQRAGNTRDTQVLFQAIATF